MPKKTARFRYCLLALVCSSIVANPSYGKQDVDIQSYVLRNRVIVTDRVVLKKALYVSFSIMPRLDKYNNLDVQGQLFNEGKIVSRASLAAFHEKKGNLVFDLPYAISDGSYTISIDVVETGGNPIASGFLTVPRSDLTSYFDPKTKTAIPQLKEIPYTGEPDEVQLTNEEKSRGYVVFSRLPLTYVFPESKPKQTEIVDHLSTQTVRNSSATLTFSLYPLRDLGKVTISISDLQGKHSSLSKDRVQIASIESVQETTGLPQGKFQNVPVLLKPSNHAEVSEGRCQRFWITIRIAHDVFPETYKGKITISPQHGTSVSLPVVLTVVPVSLEDIPEVDYCMLMTYEFTELTMPWKHEEKDKIYASAYAILKDYREHGMTTLCFHSPFVLMTKEDGTPNLDDIFAALKAARDAGFKRPIVWYMGHLIQTSKPKHPGNINGFDADVHINRLAYLVKTVTEYARKNGCPEVIFLPIDEPDDVYQDVHNKRSSITPLLLKAIKDGGAKSMVTSRSFTRFSDVDYIASGQLVVEELTAAQAKGSRYWIYDNKVAMDCTNPAYARYRYGYYTWKTNIDGMSSWTFQNTQNAGGPPGKANASGRDIYLAYPAPHGPLSTIKWEAIREGINDHKLIYQLMKRIGRLKKKGIDTARYEVFLNDLREEPGEPCCNIEACQERDVSVFEQKRNSIISMILEADHEIQ